MVDDDVELAFFNDAVDPGCDDGGLAASDKLEMLLRVDEMPAF